MTVRLETAANAATIIAAVLVAAIAGQQWITADKQARKTDQRSAVYATGSKLPAINGVSYDAADRSVVLFVQSKCGFCKQSMPFYQRLQQNAKAQGGRIQLVAIGRETEGIISDYLSSNGVVANKVVSLTDAMAAQMRLTGTPTLMVVDRQGVVIGAWRGLLPAEAEATVLRSIRPS